MYFTSMGYDDLNLDQMIQNLLYFV